MYAKMEFHMMTLLDILGKAHWSMYTSLCRYLRVLPVRHMPIFWNKMAATHLLTAEVVSVFIFVVVNTA